MSKSILICPKNMKKIFIISLSDKSIVKETDSLQVFGDWVKSLFKTDFINPDLSYQYVLDDRPVNIYAFLSAVASEVVGYHELDSYQYFICSQDYRGPGSHRISYHKTYKIEVREA